MNRGEITELWAYIAENPEQGEEGIVAGMVPGVGATPMVFAREVNALLVKPVAKRLAKDSGKTIRLVKFTRRRAVEAFEP